MSVLKIAAVFSSRAAAVEQGKGTDSLMLRATSQETQHLPFAAILLGSSAKLMALNTVADVGLYLVSERTILNAPLSALDSDQRPGSVGVFPMVAHPDLGSQASDEHWRLQHAPLALEVHTMMTHYYQLSIVHRFAGPQWNGFALCCFKTESDLRLHFFNSKGGERRIAEDVRKFADTRRSPRRVVATLNGTNA